MESNIETLKESMEEEVAKELKNIDGKMKTTLGDISKQFSELKSTIETKSKGKVTKKEVKDLQSKLNEKVSLSEVQSALNSMQADLVAKFLEVNDQIKQTE